MLFSCPKLNWRSWVIGINVAKTGRGPIKIFRLHLGPVSLTAFHVDKKKLDLAVKEFLKADVKPDVKPVERKDVECTI